ncbi:cytochrome d ubiquinol oxidase subunit II [Porphyromonas sp. COT-239 OH1446]|uniref:cytochrome d ubiquinol oxidase subunit II n=1 Tax=Porphyromonas sp. COT-239 OH1446 TaxID=1515613 RepID=UPI00052CB7D1|nr:cytochrome d ubiquinol oxidase subunit II [Porphyromonas sp. COT-239 OH1446]KGN69933.1 cytochrome C oxidase assembly protein [Porphyromonas sp. COT-239 OH1446]
MSYAFLQEYWWFLVSVLGALLVFLLFVQGGQSLFFSLGKDQIDRKLLVNSVGRKWEFTFTTLVVFGGAFFASFPLFYSTSFGGAYWVWMLILVCFVIQAVSYEYQNKHGNIWGSKAYQIGLFINGLLAPILLGAAVSTFFTGSNFTVNKGAIADLSGASQVISAWVPYQGIQLHGLEAVLNPWNVVFGLAVFFLSRTTALLYFINNISDDKVEGASRKRLAWNAAAFLALFLAYLGFLLTKEGFAVNPETGEIFMQAYKYFNNLIEMPLVLVLFLVGVVLVLVGILLTILKPGFKKGIWYEGVGVVLTALALFLIAGWNNTAFYPSLGENLQHSLTIRNSSSSEFTLKAMSIVSLLIPFVLAYMVYAWRALDLHKLTRREVQDPSGHNY